MGAICGVRCVGMATASSPYTRTAGLPPPTSLAVHRGVSDTRATIGVRGLPARLTVLHVTDSHVDAGPEPGREAEAEFMLSVNSQGLPDVSAGGTFTSAAAKLRSQLGKGRQEGAQLVAHTGDLVNFPSPKAVAHVQALVAEAGIPFLYVAGNHDWAYSAGGGSGRLAGSVGPCHRVTQETVGLAGLEEMRAREIGGPLAPLFGDRPGLAWTSTSDAGGLRFVGLDNSHYQVDDAQHAVLRAALELGPGVVGVVRARSCDPALSPFAAC